MRTDDRVLTAAAVLFGVGLVLHTADHLRRGTDVITRHVFWAGNLNTVLSVVAITLVLGRHRLAPLAAVAVGVPAALGVSAVHLLPHWSVFSDSLPDLHAAVVSWVAVLVEIVGAAALASAGAHELRRQRTSRTYMRSASITA